jgi:hypothetical protein
MSGLTTCPSTPNKEVNSGEEQGKIYCTGVERFVGAGVEKYA